MLRGFLILFKLFVSQWRLLMAFTNSLDPDQVRQNHVIKTTWSYLTWERMCNMQIRTSKNIDYRQILEDNNSQFLTDYKKHTWTMQSSQMDQGVGKFGHRYVNIYNS